MNMLESLKRSLKESKTEKVDTITANPVNMQAIVNTRGLHVWSLVDQAGDVIAQGSDLSTVTVRKDPKNGQLFVDSLTFEVPLKIPLGVTFNLSFKIGQNDEAEEKFAIAKIRTGFAALGLPLDEYTDEQIAEGVKRISAVADAFMCGVHGE